MPEDLHDESIEAKYGRWKAPEISDENKAGQQHIGEIVDENEDQPDSSELMPVDGVMDNNSVVESDTNPWREHRPTALMDESPPIDLKRNPQSLARSNNLNESFVSQKDINDLLGPDARKSAEYDKAALLADIGIDKPGYDKRSAQRAEFFGSRDPKIQMQMDLDRLIFKQANQLFDDVINSTKKRGLAKGKILRGAITTLTDRSEYIDNVFKEYAWTVTDRMRDLVKSSNKEVSELGIKMLVSKLPEIKANVGEEKWIETLTELAANGGDEVRQRVLTEAKAHLHEHQDDINKPNDSFKRHTLELSRLVAVYGDETDFESAGNTIVSLWDTNTENPFDYTYLLFAREFEQFLTSKDQQVADRSASLIGKRFGLSDPQQIVKYWEMSKGGEDYDSIEENIVRLASLERVRPGIAQVLYEEYGIADFRRYPDELLISQYDNRDNNDLPYGIVMYPRDDHNGAFNNNSYLPDLFDQTKGKYLLRAVECGSKREAARALIHLRDRYGEKHKISFGLVGAHGSKHRFKFGNEKGSSISTLWKEAMIEFGRDVRLKASLSKHDVARQTFARIAEFFENNAPLLLDSCSTGEDSKSVGAGISRTAKTKLNAPKLSTKMKHIDVLIDANGIDMIPDWGDEKIRATYVNGKEVVNEVKSVEDKQLIEE